MLYQLKKKLKTISSLGFRPTNWFIGLNAKLIGRIVRRRLTNFDADSGLSRPIDESLKTVLVNAPTLEEVTVSNPGDNQSPEMVTDKLDKYGICVIADFIQHAEAIKAGTATISSQSGVHCGWPQDAGGRRLMLVSNYY